MDATGGACGVDGYDVLCVCGGLTVGLVGSCETGDPFAPGRAGPPGRTHSYLARTGIGRARRLLSPDTGGIGPALDKVSLAPNTPGPSCGPSRNRIGGARRSARRPPVGSLDARTDELPKRPGTGSGRYATLRMSADPARVRRGLEASVEQVLAAPSCAHR